LLIIDATYVFASLLATTIMWNASVHNSVGFNVYRDTIGQPAGDAKAGSLAVEADAADEFLASSSSKKKKMTGFSAAALDMDDMAGGGEGGEEAEEGEDFGGLMVCRPLHIYTLKHSSPLTSCHLSPL
jgi:hypothetical protein